MGKRYYVFCGRLKEIVQSRRRKDQLRGGGDGRDRPSGRWPLPSPFPIPTPFSTNAYARCCFLRDGYSAPSVSELGEYLREVRPRKIQVAGADRGRLWIPTDDVREARPERVEKIRLAQSVATHSFGCAWLTEKGGRACARRPEFAPRPRAASYVIPEPWRIP